MKLMNHPVPDMNGYIIRSCTHNGVWVVEYTHHETNEKSLYDFVNKEVIANNGAESRSFDSMDDDSLQAMKALQKQINRSLLR